MKNFEARYHEWLDGTMPPAEAEAFEREMTALPHGLDPAGERTAQAALGELLRRHVAEAPPMPHGDFFNSELQRRIAEDTAAARLALAPKEKADALPTAGWLQSLLGRLTLASAACLLLGVIGYRMMIQPQLIDADQRPETDYIARVIEARTTTPAVSATSFYLPAEKASVVWLNGAAHVDVEAIALEPVEDADEADAL